MRKSSMRGAGTGGLTMRVETLEARRLLTSVTLLGTYYADADSDGLADPGEVGLAGWTVEYYDSSSSYPGVKLGELATDADGSFSVTVDVASSVTLIPITQPGWALSGDSGLSVYVGGFVGTHPRNFFATPGSVARGRMYHDVNLDGVLGAADPLLTGWTVFDDVNRNRVLDDDERFAETDGSGTYQVGPLGNGQHWLTAVPKSGYATGRGARFLSISTTQRYFAQDFNAAPTESISGVVFHDLDGDATRDPGEPGVAGVSVALRSGGESLNPPGGGFDPVAVTDDDGRYVHMWGWTGGQLVTPVLAAGWKHSPTAHIAQFPLLVDQVRDFAVREATSSAAVDTTFGDGGIIARSSEPILDIASDTDGRVAVLKGGGWVSRYTANGQGQTAFIMPNVGVTELEALPNGRLLAGGAASHQFAAVQYTSSLQLDPAFGSEGIARVNFDLGTNLYGNYAAMARNSVDGKILLVAAATGGATGMRLAASRLFANGTVDSSFGTGGKTLIELGDHFLPTAAAVQGSKYLVAGYYTEEKAVVIRLNANGSLDTTFGTGGRVTTAAPGTSRWNAVHVRADGKILLGGQAGGSFRVERLTSSGAPDASFGTGGAVVTTFSRGGATALSVIESLAAGADGRLWATGTAHATINGVSEVAVAAYTASGALDATFDGDGRTTVALSPWKDVVVDAVIGTDGGLVIGATTDRQDMYLTRLNGPGGSSLNLPPVANAGSGYQVSEGTSITLAGTATDTDGTIAAYEWDLNYDGVTFQVDATGQTPPFSAASIDGPATRTVALRARDDDGAVSAIVTATVTIANAPPTGVFGNSGPVTAGGTATVSFTGSADSAPADVTAGLRYSFDFDNDGVLDITGAVTATATVPAAYLSTPGTRTVRGRIADDDGGFTDYTTAITVNSASPSEVIVDNTAATLAGAWSTSTGKAGFIGANYLHDANAGKGTKSVRWTPGLAEAGWYQVFARWTDGADRASNAPYDVTHAGGTATVAKDQRTGGGAWQSLGTWQFSAGTAGNVLLRTTGTTGFVIADAVRFVKVAPPTAPSGASAVAQSPTGVRVTWADNSTTETGFKVQRKGPADADFVTLTTTAAGATSYDDNAAAANTAYQYRVVATSGAGDSAASNVASVTTPPANPPPGGDEVIVDNAAATLVGTWSTSTTTPGYHGSNYLHDGKAGKGTKSVRWTPTLAAAGTYAVHARWIGGTDRPTNAPYDVTHAGGTATVLKDQRTNGGSWQLLGQWQFDAGTTGSVLLRTTGTTGYVIADAVRFVKVVATTPEVIVDNTAATASAGWTASTGKAGYYGANYLHDGNAGKGTKTVTYSAALPSAGTYKVYGRWTSGTDRASNARYDVTHAGGTSTVYADQRVNGGAWVLLGEWTFTTTGQVVLSNAGTSGYVIADAVRFVKV